ncbi:MULTISPECIES: hypothetical protein [unclassified Streptomyces]|uniref:hypothetical protein n=1 Tax=unclassified Streptomyces TaxID=2593676 RepID=UPI00342D1B4C
MGNIVPKERQLTEQDREQGRQTQLPPTRTQHHETHQKHHESDQQRRRPTRVVQRTLPQKAGIRNTPVQLREIAAPSSASTDRVLTGHAIIPSGLAGLAPVDTNRRNRKTWT